MGNVAGIQFQIDGGSWEEVGTLDHPAPLPVIVPPGVHAVRVREYDDANPPNYANPSNIASVNVPYDFDGLSNTDARWFALDRLREDYTGPIAQVDISGTPTDLADRAAVIAAAPNEYELLRVYAQDGSGVYLQPIGGTTPILKESVQDGKPCWYDGVMGLSSYTGWNGKTHVNVVIAFRTVTQPFGALWSGGVGGVKGSIGYNSEWYIQENSTSGRVRYPNAHTRTGFGSVHRYHYDGSQTLNTEKLQVNINHISRAGDSDSDFEEGTVASTYTNATGFYVGGLNDGTSAKDDEYFGAHIFCYDIEADWEGLKNRIGHRLFGNATAQGFFSGDSLTESYNLNATDPTHTYPSQVITSLESITGRDWSRLANGQIAEVAAPISRIRYLAMVNGTSHVDDWNFESDAVVTAGSNDLALGATLPAKTFTADATTNKCASTAHGFVTCVPIQLSNAGGALPGGLSAGVSLCPVVDDNDHFYLALTPEDAYKGNYIDITSAGTGTHTATPVADGDVALLNLVELAKTWLDIKTSRVIVDSITPRTDLGSGNAAFDAARDVFLAGFETAFPSEVELIHFGEHASVQDPSDGAWYNVDQVHGNLAYYTLKAQIVVAAILHNALPPVASFTADVVSGSSPLDVQFTDTSSPTATSWFWDFGDGDTSTLQNPSHTYSTPGSYNVVLTATNTYGSDDSDTQVVNVTAPELANADIPHLEARWKATSTDISSLTDGANVSDWSDFAGNSHDAHITGGTADPTKQTVSGLPCVRFAEAGHIYMPFDNPIAGSMLTIFVVASTIINDGGTFIGGAANGVSFNELASAKDSIFKTGNFSWLDATNANTPGVKYIRAMRFNGTTGDVKLWRNGAANGSGNIGAQTLSVPLSELFAFGAGAGSWIDGDVFEIIVCDDVLTDAEVDDIFTALNAFHNAY